MLQWQMCKLQMGNDLESERERWITPESLCENRTKIITEIFCERLDYFKTSRKCENAKGKLLLKDRRDCLTTGD